MYPDLTAVSTSIKRCLSGDTDEASRLYSELLPPTIAFLQNLGASLEEAETLAMEVMCDCLVGTATRPALISKYHGRSSISSWVNAVARNKYYDFLRRKRREHALAARLLIGLADEEGIDAKETQDEALLDALRLALRRAFDSISATDKVLLHLVHGHNVDQRILAKILGWSDTKMSRHLSALRSELKVQVELFLINSQSGMAPRWKDIVEVCGRMVEPL